MNKALLVIDVQNYFMNSLTRNLPSRIRTYIENHRKDFEVIIFTNFVNDSTSNSYKMGWEECVQPPDTELVDELKIVIPLGYVFSKKVLSCLRVPKIKKMLEEKQVEELYICGIDTDCCVLATAYDAFDEGYKITLLANLSMAHAGKNLHDSATKMIIRNVGKVKNV